MIVQEVPLVYVNQIWPQVERFITDALQHSDGEYTVDDARVFVTTGAWHLAVALMDDGSVCGAALVSYFNRPRDRVAFVMAAGGRMITKQDTLKQFEDIMRSNGATCWEGAVRDSVAKLLALRGTRHKYSIVGKSL